jgi:sulfate permease, SulP family
MRRSPACRPSPGLWAVLPGLLVYAVLGTSRQLSVGPESTTALMTAAGVAALLAAGAGAVGPSDIAALLAIAVGLICVLGWLLRLGFLAELLSKPVLVGYMAGIAVLMVVSQLDKIMGIETSRAARSASCGSRSPTSPTRTCRRSRWPW